MEYPKLCDWTKQSIASGGHHFIICITPRTRLISETPYASMEKAKAAGFRLVQEMRRTPEGTER